MIRRSTSLILVPLMLIALPAAALAQAVAEEAPTPVAKADLTAELDADYADLDANGDGKVEPDEINARLNKSATEQLAELAKQRDAAFARYDTDGDGAISQAEFEAQAKLPDVPTPDPKPFLARFDADKDGSISKEEFRAPTLGNFDRMDANKDGTLSVAEQKAAEAKKKAPDIGR